MLGGKKELGGEERRLGRGKGMLGDRKQVKDGEIWDGGGGRT